MKLKAFLIMLLVVLSIAPITLAENQTAVPKGRAYGLIESISDRIALWFAWKDEQKLAIMNKIQERREAHYQFLLQNNKIEQANRFRERTQEMLQNFEQQRMKIQERQQTRLRNMSETQVQTQEQIQERKQTRDPTTHDTTTTPLRQGAN